MRPFLLSFLKCTKCSSTSFLKIEASSIEEIKLDASVSIYNDKILKKKIDDEDFQNFLFSIIDSIEKLVNFADISEADVLEYIEDPDSDSSDKIKKILFGTRIISGKLHCTECYYDGTVIENGIVKVENNS